MLIEPGSSFNVVFFGRTALSHLLLVFSNRTTDGVIKCVVPVSGADPIIVVVDEVSPDVAVALSGEVAFPFGGEWTLQVYAQPSDDNLDPATDGLVLLHTETAQVGCNCGCE